MTGKAQRQSTRGAGYARDNAGAVLGELELLDIELAIRQIFAQVFCAFTLVPRGVDRVYPHQVLREFY